MLFNNDQLQAFDLLLKNKKASKTCERVVRPIFYRNGINPALLSLEELEKITSLKKRQCFRGLKEAEEKNFLKRTKSEKVINGKKYKNCNLITLSIPNHITPIEQLALTFCGEKKKIMVVDDDGNNITIVLLINIHTPDGLLWIKELWVKDKYLKEAKSKEENYTFKAVLKQVSDRTIIHPVRSYT